MPETALPGPAPRARRLLPTLLLLGGATAALLLSRIPSYLLFHTLAELYSICIAFTFFVLAWHTKERNENPAVAVLGIAYLFVALLDLFHTLSYAGMDIFVGYSYPANQVWVLARFLEAGSLLGFSFVRRLPKASLAPLVALFGLYSLLGLASIFLFRIFPACFVAGAGQTPFKVAAEILVMLLLAGALLSFRHRRRDYPREVYRYLQASIAITILSELSFTLYLSNYDWVNMTGHLLKILSFYLMYRAVIVTGLERPEELLFAKLQERNRELLRSNETKDTFISLLSHDLRGPLGGIKTAAEYLHGEGEDLDRQTKEEFLGELARSAASTLELVEEILGWARSQSGELRARPEPCDGSAVLRGQVELLAETARAKGLRLRLEAPETFPLLCDPAMLGSILRNLLQNAVKFSYPGAEVEARLAKAEGGALYSVRDRGIGMGKETLGRLFRLEGRVRSRGTAGEQGTGFGLILAKEFARQLGAELSVESEEGEGSTFSLRLPASALRPPA